MIHIPTYLVYLLSTLLGMAICIFTIPNIIAVAKVKRLYDRPDGNRKIHKTVVTNLGGVGIFLEYTVISAVFVDT